MPRKARQISISGYSHVICRGIERQIIFREQRDGCYFLKKLEILSCETEVNICAYCLMDNHVHLLVYDSADNLAIFMKRLETSYANYFNKKYDRCGHLFQNRYGCERIEDEKYLLTVFRYILNNPVKAGICKDASSYRWSSYYDYINKSGFIKCDLIHELLSSNDIDEFLNREQGDQPLEIIDRISDDEAKMILDEVLESEGYSMIHIHVKETRNRIIVNLKEKGLSVRQISKLTGLNRGMIQRIKE